MTMGYNYNLLVIHLLFYSIRYVLSSTVLVFVSPRELRQVLNFRTDGVSYLWIRQQLLEWKTRVTHPYSPSHFDALAIYLLMNVIHLLQRQDRLLWRLSKHVLAPIKQLCPIRTAPKCHSISKYEKANDCNL